jgi:DNA-binding transcriptional LysR family regulator
MNLRRLEYFCAVADELHFGRAAERLHMAQPPLSQQIRRLESELGFELFERTTRRVVLTPRGRDLHDDARRLVAEARRLENRVEELRTGQAGTLRLGFVDSASYEIMPRLVRALRSRWPAVEYQLRTLSSDSQIEALQAGEIDLGLARTGPPALSPTAGGSDAPHTGAVTALLLTGEPLVVAVDADHPLARTASVELSALSGQPFVGFDRMISPRLHFELVELLAVWGVDYDPVIEATDYTTVVGLVASGQGVALVPAGVRTFRPPSISYLDIADAGATVSLLLLRRSDEDSLLVERATSSALALFSPSAVIDQAPRLVPGFAG